MGFGHPDDSGWDILARSDVIAGDCINAAKEEIARLRTVNEALRRDAEAFAWLRPRYVAADFNYGDPPMSVIVFEIPKDAAVSANLDMTIAAMRKEG